MVNAINVLVKLAGSMSFSTKDFVVVMLNAKTEYNSAN